MTIVDMQLARDAELSRDDLKAFRAANDHAGLFFSQGRGFLRVSSKVNAPGFGEQIVDRHVPVESTFEWYEQGKRVVEPQFHKFAVAVIHLGRAAGREQRQWTTIVRSFRAGDKLRVHWMHGNDSAKDVERGISHDECWLETLRLTFEGRETTATWKVRETFLVAMWAGPENDRWRMIRDSEV